MIPFPSGLEYYPPHPQPPGMCLSFPVRNVIQSVLLSRLCSSASKCRFVINSNTTKKRQQVKMAVSKFINNMTVVSSPFFQCTSCAIACKRCDENCPCERCVGYGQTDSCVDGVRKERKKGIKGVLINEKVRTIKESKESKKQAAALIVRRGSFFFFYFSNYLWL